MTRKGTLNQAGDERDATQEDEETGDKEHTSASELTGRKMHSEGSKDSEGKTAPLHGKYIMADDTVSALEARRSVL